MADMDPNLKRSIDRAAKAVSGLGLTIDQVQAVVNVMTDLMLETADTVGRMAVAVMKKKIEES